MSMTLQDMTNVATLTRNLASKASTAGNTNGGVNASGVSDPLAGALDTASKRISTQVSQTNVQLSSYGQIKSGFASLQTTGKALTTLAKDATAGDVSKAAQSLANAFNSTSSAVSTAVNGNSKSAGALANDQLARLASNDLRRVVTSSAGIADLQNIGISVGQNGTLSVDTKALEKAFQANPDAVKSTLSKLGQQANTSATQELSSSGAVGSAVNSLNNRAKNLAAAQQQQQNLGASAQAAIQQSADQSASFGGMSAGISAYMKMFSL